MWMSVSYSSHTHPPTETSINIKLTSSDNRSAALPSLQTLCSSILIFCLEDNGEALYYWFEIMSKMSLRKDDEQSFSSLSYLKFSSFCKILTMLRNELWFSIQHVRAYKFKRDTAIYFVKVLDRTHLIKERRQFFWQPYFGVRTKYYFQWQFLLI